MKIYGAILDERKIPILTNEHSLGFKENLFFIAMVLPALCFKRKIEKQKSKYKKAASIMEAAFVVLMHF